MQTISSNRIPSQPAPEDSARNSAAKPEKGGEKTATPKITAPTSRSARQVATTTGQRQVQASVQQNQVSDTPRSNEDPAAILSHLSNARPTLKQSATQYADDYLNNPKHKRWIAPRVNERLNVKDLALVDFTHAKALTPSSLTNSLTPIRYDPTSLKTTPLEQLFVANNHDSRKFDPDERQFGVYKKSDLDKPLFVTASALNYTSHAENRRQQADPDVAATALSLQRLDAFMKGDAKDPRAGAANNFPDYHKQQLKTFFSENRDQIALARRDQVLDHIDQAAQRRAGIATGSVETEADEPRFDRADEDMIKSTLDGSIKGAAKVYPLRIGQHDSINAQRFTDHTGRTALHMPGEKHPLRAFDNLDQAQAWMTRAIGDGGEQRISEFAKQHFSRNDATNRTGDSAKSVVDQLRSTRAGQAIGMETATPIAGDPYQLQATLLRDKSIADDKFDLSIAGTPDDQQKIAEQTSLALAGDITVVAPLAQDTSTTGISSAQPPAAPVPTVFPRNGTATEQFSFLQSRYPSLPLAASNYARQYMKDAYQLDVDPDKTVLAEFSNRGRGRYVDRDLSEAKLTTLSQLFAENFDNDRTEANFDPDSGKFGIYPVESEHQTVRTGTADDPQAGQYSATPSLLNAQTLFWDMTDRQVDPRVTGRPNKNHGNHFATEFTRQRSEFFAAHGDDVSTAMKTYALEQLSAAHGNTLNDADYALVRDAFSGTPGRDVSVQSMHIDRVAPTGALLMSNTQGRTIAYFPGEKTPFAVGNNKQDITDWLRQKREDVPWREEFVASQFSLRDATLMSPFKSSDETNPLKSVIGVPGTTFIDPRPGRVSAGQHITGDPFKARTDVMMRKEEADLMLQLKSNAELAAGQVLNTAGHVVPFPNTLTAILAQGRTQAEAQANIPTELMTAPLEFLPGLKAVKKGAQAFRKAAASAVDKTVDTARQFSGNWPKIKLPQRVNGNIGYPLSPVGAPALPGTPQGTVMPPAGGLPNRPVSQGPQGIVNEAFTHSESDIISPLRPWSAGGANRPRTPEQFEMKKIDDVTGGGASVTSGSSTPPQRATPPRSGDGASVATQTPFNRSAGTQTNRLSGSGTPPGSPTSQPNTTRAGAAEPDLDFDIDPDAAQLEAANRILKREGMDKTVEPAWLQKPDWLTDEYVQSSGMVLPSGATTVDEMIALQQTGYAEMVNRQTMRLAQAYRDRTSPTEINALVERQSAVQGDKKQLILSQWAQINPTQPLTRVDLKDISILETRIPGFRARGKAAIARLKESQARKQQELTTLLSQNMTNNEAVRTRQTQLQQQLDDELKQVADNLKTFIQKASWGAAGVGLLGGGGGLAAWMVKEIRAA